MQGHMGNALPQQMKGTRGGYLMRAAETGEGRINADVNRHNGGYVAIGGTTVGSLREKPLCHGHEDQPLRDFRKLGEDEIDRAAEVFMASLSRLI